MASGILSRGTDLLHGVHRRQLRHLLEEVHRHRRARQVSGETTLGVAREIEARINGRALLQAADVDARLAESLHGHQAHHAARPVGASRGAAGCAEAVDAAGGEIGLLAAPSAPARARLWPERRSLPPATPASWQCRLPCRGCSRATSRSRMVRCGDVLLVVELLRDPHIGNGQHHGAVGARPRSQPLASQPGRRVVVIGIDMHAAECRGPSATGGERCPRARRRLRWSPRDRSTRRRSSRHSSGSLRRCRRSRRRRCARYSPQ